MLEIQYYFQNGRKKKKVKKRKIRNNVDFNYTDPNENTMKDALSRISNIQLNRQNFMKTIEFDKTKSLEMKVDDIKRQSEIKRIKIKKIVEKQKERILKNPVI